jgi:hypothetical protein
VELAGAGRKGVGVRLIESGIGRMGTDVLMIDFLRRRSDGSERPSMCTVATGSLGFGDGDGDWQLNGDWAWARGHSMVAEGWGTSQQGQERERVVMFPSAEEKAEGEIGSRVAGAGRGRGQGKSD